jgi:hypothetical protein
MLLLSQNFWLGVFGAFLTLYLSKQVAIPELRALYDASGMEAEADKLRRSIDDARGRLNSIEAQYVADPSHLDGLKAQWRAVFDQTRFDQRNLDRLERRLMIGQMISKGGGFALFVLFGGVVAYLLTGDVNVSNLVGTASVPQGLQAVAIGAGWNGLLSVFGIRNIQDAATQQVEAVKDQTVQQLNALRTGLDQTIRPGSAQAPAMVPFSAQAGLSAKVSEQVDATLDRVNAQFDEARRRLQQNFRRVL